jgi:ATP-dependent helicase/nuclease subunit A
MLVEAGAGAGKTTCMVERMVALLREGRCEVGTLAAVTFTRKSAAELRSRFQAALHKTASDAGLGQGERQRLQSALSHVERAFIGTIHSFCARLLRERPVEAGIDPAFTEIDEAQDLDLRRDAWRQFVASLHAREDPLLEELEDVDLPIGELEESFLRFANFPDVAEWPAPRVDLPPLKPIAQKLYAFAQHVESLLPFPDERGNDQLMDRYEHVLRLIRNLDLTRPSQLMRVLALMKARKVVEKQWPGGKQQAKQEEGRWASLCGEMQQPYQQWLARRYHVVLRVLHAARETYDRLRQVTAVLNFQDLLLRAAALLRDHQPVRRYFSRRFTHLLVDEFQDTDPIQAEVMLLLTADDPAERDWRRCSPRLGSLFVVGDPKQSIYRFRRADIVTYNQVRQQIDITGGAVVPLTANFRTTPELVEWVNGFFTGKFAPQPTPESPAYAPMAACRDTAANGQLAGLWCLNIPAEHKQKDRLLEYEARAVAAFINQALQQRLRVPRTAAELRGGLPEHAVPSDFLIVTRTKKMLAVFARALREAGIPHEVAGGSALGQSRELALLAECLRAVVRPFDPVALLAVLRGELFGINDRALFAFRQAGGAFDFRRPLPDGLEPGVAEAFRDAFSRLDRYASWLRQLMPVAALQRIADDLGLLARAAASPGGNELAGLFSKALARLREEQAALASPTELAQALDRMLQAEDDFDALPALAPDPQRVRLMNLHKVKGLEAPIVLLAGASGKANHEPDLYIDRSGDVVRGWLAVRKRGNFNAWPLAEPLNWKAMQEREAQFQAAEETRLMYVAATRAGVQLVISQAPNARYDPWHFFAPALGDAKAFPAVQPEPVGTASRSPGDAGQPPAPVPPIAGTGSQAAAAAEAVATRWKFCASPTYELHAAKQLALSLAQVHFQHAGSEWGLQWGTLVHLLLEAAMRSPGADLRPLALQIVAEEGLDPSMADDALHTAASVMQSGLWQRARAASICLVEVPFTTLLPQAEQDADDARRPALAGGVIDLVFKEPQGWVIVDYKTDQVTSHTLAEAAAQYRPQVQLYAQVWTHATGEPVHECGLYFTTVGQYLRV